MLLSKSITNSPNRLWLKLRVTALCVMVWLLPSLAQAQQVKIWEFSPYEVAIWHTVDPAANLSDYALESYLDQLKDELRRTFRATWSVQVSELSTELQGIALRKGKSLTLEDLKENELVLVTSLEHEKSKSLRTYSAAIEALEQIAVSANANLRLTSSAEKFGIEDDPLTSQLIEKCQIDDGGLEAIKAKLSKAEIPGALIPRFAVPDIVETVKPHLTLLPWQSESIFRRLDKVFFLHVRAEGDGYAFQVRELDCPMQFFGDTFESRADHWMHAARITAETLTHAFAPIARVEDAEAKTAQLRMRAGGLIVDKNNPAYIGVGDVMQPIVRRDDRNGVPTLLEPLSWTFAAITATDGVKMDANVYTYSGGPGLQGRKNRRTRRVLLRVRPLYDKTDISVVIRGKNGEPQSGCFVYDRNLLTEEFELLGRTDWRGRFTVTVPQANGKFLPEEIRRERYLAKREAEKKAMEAEAAAKNDENAEEGDESPPAAEEPPPADPIPPVVEYEPENDPDALPLNFPLTHIYLKNGNTVLAKLPMVPGLREVEVAELTDDRRRLEAEAFVRGFQGEILDLIGLRNLLAAQVQHYLKKKELAKAEEALEKLRDLKNYNEMADELSRIQQDILDEADGAIPFGAKRRIDPMFQNTRAMLQKYLQDNLLRDAEQAVRAAQ